LELDPYSINAHYAKACAYSGLGDNEKAEVEYTEAVETTPRNYGDFFTQGLAYARLHDNDAAILCFSAYIENSPDPSWACNAYMRI